MAQITVQKSLDGTTTKSILNINEVSRTAEKTTFSLNFLTNLVSSSGFIGAGESLDGIVQISSTGMTAQTKTVTLKSNSESWSGSAVHTKNDVFEVTMPSSITSVAITYTLIHRPSGDYISNSTSLLLTKLISQLNPFKNNSRINFEEKLKLSITQYDSSYTNNLIVYYRDGDNLREIGSWSNVKNEDEIQLTETQLNALYEMTKNTKYFNITWKLTTLSDETELGYMTLPGVGLISDANPIFNNFEYEDANRIVLNVTLSNQTIVSGASTLKATISVANKAIAQKGATMVSYLINDVAVDYSSDSVVSLEIYNYNKNTIKVAAVDSRGNSTTVEKVITDFIEYNVVSINQTSATISRTNDSEEETKISFEGSFWNGNFGKANNTLNVFYKYRLAGSTGEYTIGNSQIIATVDGNTFSVTDKAILGDTDNGFDTSNSYEIIVSVNDLLSINEITYILIAGKDAIVIEGNKVISINDIPFNDLRGKDYVVESNSDTQWEWQKWASGMAECWGNFTASGTSSLWANPLYVLQGANVGPVNYPFEFTETPMEQANVIYSKNSCWLCKNSGDESNQVTTTHTAQYVPTKVNAFDTGTQSITASIYVKGKWK